MSFKWNEKSTLVFLNAYQKYPCLWNPNHVKYYNCLAKNEALKNIIKELNIPELNISDCLEQIKIIREKYGQEQLRIIKALQLHKPYKPSFAWFPVISEMLAKVIYDEGKLQKRIRSMKKMSPYALQDYVTILYDKDENVLNFPCAQKETKEHNEAHKANSKKNTKSTKTEYVPTNSDELSGKNKFNMLSDLLQCPTCAWEDNSDKLEINAKKKINEYTKPTDVTVSSSEYINFADKPYNTYQQRAVDDVHQQEYTVPNSNFSQNSNKVYYSNILTNHTFSPQNAHTNQQTQTMFVESKLQPNNNHMKEIQLSNERLLPGKEVKRTRFENHNKGIQNTICVSRRKIARIPRKCTKNISALQKACPVEIDKQKYYKEIQNKSSNLREEMKQIAINTVKQRDQGTQSTVVEKTTSTTQTSERVDVNSIKSPKYDTQNVAGLKTAECSKPNFILITIDEHCMPSLHVDSKLEQLIDKWKDERIPKRDQKEVEETRVTLEDKKPIEDEDSITETCSDDTMEILKHNSIVTQALLQCLEKMIQFQEENSSEMTVCEPCKFAVKSKNFASNSVVESESPSCLPCVKEMENTEVIGTLVKSFLELMKHALLLNGKKRIKNRKCISKKDAIDAFIFLNKMKECADKILKIHMIANCLKKQSLNKFCPGRNKYPPKPNFIPSSIKTEVSENDTEPSAVTSEEEDVQLLYASPKSEITDDTISENHVALEVEEKPSVKDEGVLAYVEKCDVAVDALPQVLHHDTGTQYERKELQDVEIKQNFKKIMEVGTQTCELILFLNAEYNGEPKLDKEMCHAHRSCAWTRYIQKYMEIYPLLRPCLPKTTCQKYFIREPCNEELHSDGQIHEKEMNYHACSLSKKNNKCNGQCSNTLPYNLLPLECSENTVSRIPSYTRSCKYVRRRADLYNMSQFM